MESIHLKTVDPTSQGLLRAAAQRAIDLNWERYERQQPQDGFLRIGLACPFGCMQGPCRIDPFGRGANTGLCGLGRDGMVAAMVLRLAVNGALEAMNLAGKPGELPAPLWPKALAKLADKAAAKLGGGALSASEAFSGAAALAGPGEPAPTLVRRALRLGLLTLGLSGVHASRAARGKAAFKVGLGVLAGKRPTIGVCGMAPAALVDNLVRAAGAQAHVVSLGMWVGGKALLPMVCTSGEAELVISSGAIDAVLYEPVAGAAVPALCAKLGIPAVAAADADAKKLVAAAAKVHGKSAFAADPTQVAEGEIVTSAAVADALKAHKKSDLAVIGGPDTLQQSLGSLPTELLPALAAECRVATWGDAALWIAKRRFAGGSAGAEAYVLDDARGPLDALEAAAAAGGLKWLRGIAFTALGGTRDFATALGAAALGARVCVAQPLPLWGSEETRRALAEAVGQCGGAFAHFDHPATADEIRAWFDQR
jgi:hypothetical protein